MKRGELRISTFLLLFLCVFLLFFNFNTFLNLLKTKEREKELKELIENLTQKKQELILELERIKNLNLWEERMRRQGFGKVGEKRIVIQFPENFFERKLKEIGRESIFEKILKLFRREK